MAFELFDLGADAYNGTKKKQKPKKNGSAIATPKPVDKYSGAEQFWETTKSTIPGQTYESATQKTVGGKETLTSKVKEVATSPAINLVKGLTGGGFQEGAESAEETSTQVPTYGTQGAKNRAYVRGLPPATSADFEAGQNVPMFLDSETNQWTPVRYQDWTPEMGPMQFAKFTDVFRQEGGPVSPGMEINQMAVADPTIQEGAIFPERVTQLKPELIGDARLQGITLSPGEEEALGIYAGDPESATYKSLGITPPEGVSEYSVPTDVQAAADLARTQGVYEDVKDAFEFGDITILGDMSEKQLSNMRIDLFTASPEYATNIKKAVDAANLEAEGFTKPEAELAAASLSDFAAGKVSVENFDISSIIKTAPVYAEDGITVIGQTISPSSEQMLNLYTEMRAARTSEKMQEARRELDEISVYGQASDIGKKTLAQKQLDQETNSTLSRIYGRPMTQESLDGAMDDWANMSDEEKDEFRTVELRNLETAVEQFDEQMKKEYQELALSIQEFQAQGGGYVMEYDPEDGVFKIAEEEVTETITNEDGTTSTVTKKVPLKTVDRKRTEQDIAESQARIKDAQKNQTIARDELQFRAMATDEENFQRQQERLSREYQTEITLQSETANAQMLQGKEIQARQSMQEQAEYATAALQKQSQSHQAALQTQAEAFERERLQFERDEMESQNRIAALNAAVQLEQQQSQQQMAALQTSVGLLTNIMSNPYGYFAAQQLGGIEGMMGGGAGQTGVVPGLAGLEGLGYQQPDATAGQAVAPQEFFGGSIPTLGALQGVSEPTLNLLTSLLQFTGTTPEAFSQQAAGVTPAAQRMYQMPTFAPTGAPAYRGAGPSSPVQTRIAGSYAGSTGADILAGRAGRPLGGRV